eukprot:SAG22_NODE_3958_length_1450_cov_1.106588_2_plen_167_part_00
MEELSAAVEDLRRLYEQSKVVLQRMEGSILLVEAEAGESVVASLRQANALASAAAGAGDADGSNGKTTAVALGKETRAVQGMLARLHTTASPLCGPGKVIEQAVQYGDAMGDVAEAGADVHGQAAAIMRRLLAFRSMQTSLEAKFAPRPRSAGGARFLEAPIAKYR